MTLQATEENNADAILLDSEEHVTHLQGVLEYGKTELVAAKMKVILASHALGRSEGSYLAAIEDILVEPGFNLRLEGAELDAHISSIADSILSEGFYEDEPIAVYAAMRGKKPVFIVTDGHCRTRAAQLAISRGAELNYLPIVIKSSETTMEDLIVAMVRTSQKRRLTPYETAIGCKRLRMFNVAAEIIAKRLGFTVEYVDQLLELAGAPYAIRSMVEAGKVTAALAISTMRAHGPEASEVLGSALDQAQAAGKSKITAKNLPNQMYKKALKKSAPKMFAALQGVKASPLYAQLPDATRTLIDELFETLADAPDVGMKDGLTLALPL